MSATAGAFSGVSRNDGWTCWARSTNSWIDGFARQSVQRRATYQGRTGHIGRFDSRRYRQRRYRIHLFGREVQRRAARGQDPHAGSRDQDLADQARGRKELLEVVEHEE